HALSSCNCSNPALTVMLVTGSAVLYLGDTQSGSWDNGHEAPFQVQYPCDDGGGCILSYWRGTSSSTLHVEPFVGGAFDVSLSNGVYWAILLDVNACTYDTGNAASEFLQTPNCSFSD
ncbi:MAG TPA: hypothetical protein VLY63_12655, partial [Anaerolineae bacterium]|nr:hypothetical protein [Anaerolineae bacterium]